MKNTRSLLYIFGPLGVIIPLVVALPFLYFGGREFIKSYRVTQDFVAAEGVVVDNDYVTNSDGGLYVPVVRFTTAEGETVRFSDSIGSYPPAFEEGEQVSILYNPEDSHDAHIDKFMRIWFLPVLLIGIGLLPGLIMLVIALGSLFQQRTRQLP